MSGRLAALRERIRSSAWLSLAGKAGLCLGGLLVLAAIGGGGLRSVLASPKAPAPALSASSMVGAADAGIAEDAGTIDAGSAPAGAINAEGKVILNLAAEDDLRRLPGIGSTKAKAILALRAKLGKLKRPEDLLRIKGIGRRSLARLRPLVVVD